MIRRLKALGASKSELLDMYLKHVRCVLEFAVPVWHSSISRSECDDIERVQKSALKIIFGSEYVNYEDALSEANIDDLETRRSQICTKFALKAESNPKHRKWFKVKPETNTRSRNYKYVNVLARTERLKRSPISYFTSLLNALK